MSLPALQLRMAIAVALVLVSSSCRGSGGLAQTAQSGMPPLPLALNAVTGANLGSRKIRHVVIVVQENRSFDVLFHGFPGADTASYGYGHGVKYGLHRLSLANPDDVPHAHIQFLEDYDNGKNDGWDKLFIKFKPGCTNGWSHPECWVFLTGGTASQFSFAYVSRAEVRAYWEMASRFALADRAFASNNGPTFPSHQYLISGQSNHVAENPALPPWGCDASPINDYTLRLKPGRALPGDSPYSGVEYQYAYPCYRYRTIVGPLDRSHVSWRYYVAENFENFSPFGALWNVRFSADWANVRSPETTIFNDVAGGKLADVSWVTPSYVNSDHAGSGSTTGPDWVAAVVNAIGKSQYWKDTAIVVTWDEWGGWFDHVVPPQYHDPQTGVYEGLGYRVPLIVISPYAKRRYVSHRQHEIASTLHLIESVFGLPSLGGADARADGLEDMFDFSQSPAQFKTIHARFSSRFFQAQRPALEPPDS